MTFTKEDLKRAFEQGERYDYRVTKAQCFNRWYNQNYLDAEKCKNCKYSEQKHYKNCLNCIGHSDFQPNVDAMKSSGNRRANLSNEIKVK